jgi:uncharacterized SAM-binding protein YcdF (DUF218 family)
MEAATLYKEGYAKRILLSTERSEPAFEELRKNGIGSDRAPTRNDLNFGLLIALGIPPSSILVTKRTNARTFDEAQEIANILNQDTQVRKIIVVTSSAHTRRAGKLIRKFVGQNNDSIIIRASRFDPIHTEKWWTDAIERRAIGHEWMATIFAPILARTNP